MQVLSPGRRGGVISDVGFFIDIGTVIITDLTSKATEALTESSMVYFAQSFTWAAGDKLQIAGGNETLPTFSISIQTPAQITVTSPPQIAAGQTVMARRRRLGSISWTPSTRPVDFMSVGIGIRQGDRLLHPPGLGRDRHDLAGGAREHSGWHLPLGTRRGPVGDDHRHFRPEEHRDAGRGLRGRGHPGHP